MKSKLILFYRILLNNYYHYQRKDDETAKKLAYTSVRNLIGVAIFMFLLIAYVTITGYFHVHLNLKKNRILLYLIFGALLFGFVSLSKKKLKPIFQDIEIDNEKPAKNYYNLYVFFAFLFGASMFGIARLITIYFS